MRQENALLPTWVLLQVRLDVVIFGCSSLSAAVPADGILLGSSSKLRLLVINLASVPGGQLVNSPTAAILDRKVQARFRLKL